MFLNKMQKDKKTFLKTVEFPSGFEDFLIQQYKKQQAADRQISKEAAKTPIKMDNFMVEEKYHALFQQRFFMTTKLDSFIVDFYKNNCGEECKLGTSFYYIYYGFDFYNPKNLKKIALQFMPDKKLIPFATHGHSEIAGGLCLDYGNDTDEPAILYKHEKSNKFVTVAESFADLLKG